ncbi:MAG TPA: hypothetical protein VN914_08750 [Polyangia bacterium]|nr:hypothetical protein [Polyangia bacterium]
MTTLLFLTWLTQVQIHVSFPSIRFETPPPVVEVQPNVYVVPDRDDEVFFVDGWYWTRWNDGRWYRARDHRGAWAAVAPPAVPVTLVRIPPGHYKHHHGKPDRMRVINPDGSVTEYKVKEKHGMLEVKGKGKPMKEPGGKGKGKGKWKDRDD